MAALVILSPGSLFSFTEAFGYQCPGSAATIHASCKVQALIAASCESAREEMIARVSGQPMSWHDPHNNGTYSLLSSSDDTLTLQRQTGDLKYVDKMTFSFEAGVGSCTVSGCSESQVTSIGDFSTNYCNLRMLYCGASDGCIPVVHDFTSTLQDVSPSFGATAKMSDCLKMAAGEFVAASGHVAASSAPPAEYDSCSAAITQDSLLYGISGRTNPDVPVPVDAGESLATAVCCDTRTVAFAEPQFLFSEPDIALFSKLDASGVTTFYDSACGAPLFRAPVGRSMDAFNADTQEHGWPSFREAEVDKDNVVTNLTTTLVTSACGTHLGTYLPDSQGPRWCIDLSCIAGSPSPQ